MIPHYKGNVPFINPEQMIKVEQSMTNDYGISQIQMMENAGFNLAMLAKALFLKNDPSGKKIFVLAGQGENGGSALVAARRLKNLGADVQIILACSTENLSEETRHQLSIVEKMNIPMSDTVKKGDLIIDGMVGFSANGGLSEKIIELIGQVAKTKTPVLALDAPSGLDLTTGKPSDPTMKANATMTLALPKIGLFKMSASKYTGDLYLADISVPAGTYKSIGIKSNSFDKIFKDGSVVKINKVVVFS